MTKQKLRIRLRERLMECKKTRVGRTHSFMSTFSYIKLTTTSALALKLFERKEKDVGEGARAFRVFLRCLEAHLRQPMS